MLKPGPAIAPDKKVVFPLGQRAAYEGWHITPPYITGFTMVRTKSWLQRYRTLTAPASNYFPERRFTRHVIAQLVSLDSGADRECPAESADIAAALNIVNLR
jgi:hypothetical protein